MTDFNWDAQSFFKKLTECNKFARENGYVFHPVSGLDGFNATLCDALSTQAFVCVSDTSPGALSMDNTPHTSRMKIVFLACRHRAENEAARQEAFDCMRELFRQFMSVLIREKTRLDEDCIYIDNRINFTEMERYFYTGAACAYFQIRIDTYTDLTFNEDEWLSTPIIP